MHFQKLISGHKRFKDSTFSTHKQDFKSLVQYGQKPKVLFIGCSDSRVSPNMIVNGKPGDMFITRNIGNFVPPYKKDDDFHATTAVIEYAISILKVKDIIICGHSHCGACKALYDDNIKQDKNLTHVNKWLELGQEAKEKAIKLTKNNKQKLLSTTEKESIKLQIKNLLTYPQIDLLLKEKKLNIHGWYYEIEDGSIVTYDQHTDSFVTI
ncbi:MAG: carbonic anhydrase [Campylobacteraceae bacterium 4484_166]|nr:MAG: carbonic anhydrase [Campylobacteraceae bacterium 4484_166]